MQRTIFIMLATLTAAAPAVASADTYLNVRIPASACRPTAASKAKVRLQSGAWVFLAGQSGTATLFCPVHLARPKALEDSPEIWAMRIWYRDPDADASPAKSRVDATLMEREWSDGTDTAVPFGAFSSEWFASTVYGREWVTFAPYLADFLDYTYHVEVSMYRRLSTDAAPLFAGIDFTAGPS